MTNANTNPKGREHEQAAKIDPPEDDERGDRKPGFGNEGQRSELGDGAPIDEQKRKEIAESNRRLEKERERPSR